MVSGDKPGLPTLPIEVEVELERARRLGDRFAGSYAEDSELAREQRARRFSAEFLRLGKDPGAVHGPKNGNEIAKLEASLELTRQNHLHAFLAADPAKEGGRAAQLDKVLRECLEDISVKSILDFRVAGTGVPAAEATATAAVCAIANIDETAPALSIHSLDPERPWAESLEVLSKPGHFINTLRRFPQASAKGSVPEENIVAARHFLQMAQGHREGGHPALKSLGRWLETAVQLWEAQHIEVQPERAPPPPAPKPAARVHVEVNYRPRDYRATQRNEVRRPLVVPGANNLGSPRQSRLVQPSAKVNSVGGRPTPTAGTTAKARPVAAPARAPDRLGDSARATALRRSKSQDGRQMRQASPRPAREPSPRVQRHEQSSPRLPRQVSPRPAATTRDRPAERQSSPRPPATARERTKERQSSPRRVPVTARDTPIVRERPTPRDRSLGASMRAPSSPQTGQLARAHSARRSLDGPGTPGSDPLNRSMSRSAQQRSRPNLGLRSLVSSKSASTLARVPAAQSPPSPTAELPSVEELKRMIEETKKEVREIRSVESKAKWQMTREERREKLAETVAAQSELREWRWKQAQGLKQLSVQQAQQAKALDLKESKEFVEFKRETKLRSKEVELQYQQEVYVTSKADSAWQVEQAKVNIEKEQALILEKVEDVHHLRQERRQESENAKAAEAEERALQEHLQIASLARELAREKERLLENLEFTRACMQAPIRRR